MAHDHEEFEVEGARLNTWSNRSGTQSCRPHVVTHPWSLRGLHFEIEAARKHGQCLRIAGAGHADTALCVTDGRLLTLRNYQGVVSVDRQRYRVRVRGGTSLGALGKALADKGLALSGIGGLESQTIAGAVSGGSLATLPTSGLIAKQVTGFRLLLASGEEIECSRSTHSDVFKLGRVNLGALGIVTELELQCVPAYNLELIAESRPLDEALAALKTHDASAGGLTLSWSVHAAQAGLVRATRTQTRADPAAGHTLPAALATGVRWLAARFPQQATWWLPEPAPAERRVLAATDALGRRSLLPRLRCSCFVPRESLGATVEALKPLLRRSTAATHARLDVTPVIADSLPLSPAHGGDVYYLRLGANRGADQLTLFELARQTMTEHGGRPDWAAWPDGDPAAFDEVADLDAFGCLQARLDPEGLFLNTWLSRLLRRSRGVD